MTMTDKEASATVLAGAEHGHSQASPDSDGSSLNSDIKESFTRNDQLDMKRMGKKQEFRRNFRYLTSIAFTCCVMGTWEIILTSNTQALLAGGSAGLFWSMCWAYVGQSFVVLSLAEMASMAPTSGGQYHWVSEFAPADFQRILSYLSGWLSSIAWQSFVTVDCWLVTTIIQGLVVLNDEEFVFTRWQTTLMIFASAIFFGLFNILCGKHLPLFEGVFAAFHFLAFLPIIITCLVLAPKRSASSVFLEFTDNTGTWPNVGIATLVGQVSAAFAVLGSDSVAHMSEEIGEASIVVPRSMIYSFLVNIPPTMGLIVTYLFCMPSVSDALSDPTGMPFIYVFRQVANSVGGTTGMTIVILVLIMMITGSTMASASRQTFAFARDNGLPFARWMSRVHPGLYIPVNSIITTCLFTIVVSLINIGSTVAFNAMLSLSCIGVTATYSISIGCVFYRRLTSPETLPHARWGLGKAGVPLNIGALIYSGWIFFWSFWPNSHDVDAQNFNWACALFVGLMLISSIVYLVRARHVYEGPVMKVEGTGK